MKTQKTIILAICLIATLGNLQAQKLQFSDVYLFGGAASAQTGALAQWDVNEMQRGLLQPNNLGSRGYSQNANSSRYSNQGGIMAAWKINGSEKQKLRIGFSGGSYQANWASDFYKETTYRLDTFVSQQTGEMYFVDSTHRQNLSYQHNAQMFNIHLNYLQTLNPQNKLSFYVGGGASLGMSLSNQVTVNYSENSDLGDPSAYNYYNNNGNYGSGYGNNYNNNSSYNYNQNINIFETKTQSPTQNISAFALTGLNWRLSNKNRFFKHINLFGEWQTGLQVNRMQEINNSIGFLNGLTGGLRVSFNDSPRKN